MPTSFTSECFGELREETCDMAVLEADDGDFQLSGLLCAHRRDTCGKQ